MGAFGKMMGGNGLKEIIIEADVCASGSIAPSRGGDFGEGNRHHTAMSTDLFCSRYDVKTESSSRTIPDGNRELIKPVTTMLITFIARSSSQLCSVCVAKYSCTVPKNPVSTVS